jgi:mannose/fructose/N-acetylgalactosamine-specific phosphotransferase system component IID
MTRPDLLVRSLLIQGSWNYGNLLGTGFAWALRANPEAGGADTRGHASPEDASRGADPAGIEPTFNAHPYLVTVALGAVTRAAADGEDAERVRRFRDAIQSALGSLGDNLVWGAWRPFCLLAALLAAFLGGAPGVVVAGLLIVYNAAQIGLRAWGLSAGLEKGLGVSGALRDAALADKAERITGVGVLLAGVFGGALLGEAARLPGAAAAWIVVGIALLTTGLVWGEALRRAAPVLLLVAVLGGFVGSAVFAVRLDG